MSNNFRCDHCGAPIKIDEAKLREQFRDWYKRGYVDGFNDGERKGYEAVLQQGRKR